MRMAVFVKKDCWDPEGQKHFFTLDLNNDKFLYENEYKAFDMYRETEIRFSVLMKCCIKEVLFNEFFSFVFFFKIIVYVLTTLWHPLSFSQ